MESFLRRKGIETSERQHHCHGWKNSRPGVEIRHRALYDRAMRNIGAHPFFVALALVACPVLVACANTSGSHEQHQMSQMSPAPMQHNGMEGMNMGDPSATPADKVPGAQLRTAALKLLDTRPPGMDSAAGTAWLATHRGGTTVTVRMTGLMPGEKYMTHLHALPCAQDNGGEHFRFDPKGSDKPPNEVHLAFTADQAGQGYMTANNDRAADAAKSIVVHPAEATDNRLACADF
jgi:hypothetical protein